MGGERWLPQICANTSLVRKNSQPVKHTYEVGGGILILGNYCCLKNRSDLTSFTVQKLLYMMVMA